MLNLLICYNAGLPRVTVIPFIQSIEVTYNAEFTTMVTGVGSENFTYLWKHNGLIIHGETRSNLLVTNVKESNSGNYSCIIFNQYGDTDESNYALLTVKSE